MARVASRRPGQGCHRVESLRAEEASPRSNASANAAASDSGVSGSSVRQAAEHGHAPKGPDDALVVGVRISDERDAEQRDRPAAQCLDRQERVIDGAEPRACAQHHRGAPAGEDIDQERTPRERHQQSARALDHEEAVRGGQGKRVRVDFDAVDLGGEVRRGGRPQPPSLRQHAVGGEPARRRTSCASVSSARPACTGFQYAASRKRVSPAQKTVLPMSVSVPVTTMAELMPRARPRSSASAANSAPTACSSTLSVIEMRRRAVPSGTVGGRTARTSNPRAAGAAASATAAAILADDEGLNLRAGRRRRAARKRCAPGDRDQVREPLAPFGLLFEDLERLERRHRHQRRRRGGVDERPGSD